MGRRLLQCLVFVFLLPVFSWSAKAPDFTVTDYNNKVHKLYEDYLNKDKVVVIKFFFIGCPPCASVAPYVQQSYVKWGSGSGKVEFFEMSTLTGDKNASVKNYQQSKGLTFPGVGADGGAQTVLAPYKAGNFGTWYGTPTFVVIAPNGEVDYNVPMSPGNPSALDTSISRALRLSSGGGGGGTECTNAFSVQTITKIQPDAYFMVDLLNGNPTQELDSGIYKCQFNLPQNLDELYVIPSKAGFEEAINGVTTADVVFLQQYILKLRSFNNLQFRLADVNNSGSVTAADVSELRKLILGVTSKFSKLSESYAVVHNPKSTNPLDLNNKVLVSQLINKVKTNEFGIGKYGDVTGAALFANDISVTRSASHQHVQYSTKMLQDGSWSHRYNFGNLNQLIAFQFAFRFPECRILSVRLSEEPAQFMDFEYNLNYKTAEIRTIALSEDGLAHKLNAGMYIEFITDKDASITLLDQSSIQAELMLDSEEIIHDFDVPIDLTNSKIQNVQIYYQLELKSVVVMDRNPIQTIEIMGIDGRRMRINESYSSAQSHYFQIQNMPAGMYYILAEHVSSGSKILGKIVVPQN